MPTTVRARRGRAAGFALVLVLAGTAALAAAYLARNGAHPPGDALSRARGEYAAAASQFPMPVDATGTRSYLAGAGAALLVMHRSAADQLAAGPTEGDCLERSAALQAVLGADQAYVLVVGVPDEPLREALSDERAALGAAFTRCADPALPDASAELAAAVALADLRLGALDVAR